MICLLYLLHLHTPLQDSVDRAMAFNTDPHRRSTTAWFLEAHPGRDKGATPQSPAPRSSSRGITPGEHMQWDCIHILHWL